MEYLSTLERNKIIDIYNDLIEFEIGNKCKIVAEIAYQKGINISENEVSEIIRKWMLMGKIFIYLITNDGFFFFKPLHILGATYFNHLR
jgi:hypothetical protein